MLTERVKRLRILTTEVAYDDLLATYKGMNRCKKIRFTMKNSDVSLKKNKEVLQAWAMSKNWNLISDINFGNTRFLIRQVNKS